MTMTQEDNVLLHMKTVGPITPIDALNKYGCFRLAAVIHNLRSKGYRIETDTKENGTKRYASYRLRSIFSGDLFNQEEL